jgi:hypothetical protein
MKVAVIALLAFACFAQNASQPASTNEPRTADQWRREYQQVLIRRSNIARMNLDFVHKQQSLGAAVDATEAESLAVNMERDLAAFRAGLIAELPHPALTAAMVEARDQYRTLTKRAIELAEQSIARIAKGYESGKNTPADVQESIFRLNDLELELVAFEAGLELPQHVMRRP